MQGEPWRSDSSTSTTTRPLRRFHEIGWRAEKEDGRPWNAFWSFEEMAARPARAARRASGWTPLGIFDGDEMVGGGIVWLSLEDNLDKAFVFPAVEPDRRGHGHRRRLLEGLVEHVRGLGRTQATERVVVRFEERDDLAAERFAARHGFAPANLESCAGCRFPVADALLDEIERRPPRTPRLRCRRPSSTTCPRSSWPPTATWSTSSASTPPPATWSSRRRRDPRGVPARSRRATARSGRTVLRTLAVRDGQAVAHSDLFVAPGGTRCVQWATLVHRDHRGHRLGAAVKVANLRGSRRACPTTEVVTQNAEVNAQMIGINARLGSSRSRWSRSTSARSEHSLVEVPGAFLSSRGRRNTTRLEWGVVSMARPLVPVKDCKRFWEGVRQGLCVDDASAVVGVSQATGWRWFGSRGGVLPSCSSTAEPSGLRLSFAEREEIACLARPVAAPARSPRGWGAPRRRSRGSWAATPRRRWAVSGDQRACGGLGACRAAEAGEAGDEPGAAGGG